MLEMGSGVGLKCGRLLGQGCGHVLHTTNMHWTLLIHVAHAGDRLWYGPQMWGASGPGMWTCTARNKHALDIVNSCCTCWRQALVWASNVRGFRARDVDMYCTQQTCTGLCCCTCWRLGPVWFSNVRGFRARNVDMYCTQQTCTGLCCCTCWRLGLVWFSNVRGFRASDMDMYCIQAQHIVNSCTYWRQALVWASNVRGFRAGGMGMHCLRQ